MPRLTLTVLLASELRIHTASRMEWTAHTAMADGLELSEQLAGIYHVLMQSALELTEHLRELDPADPVKYDYALFGLGVMEKY